jgi:hypothetical protein
MVNGLARAITLHQALHGYADGHRLLAASTSLKPRDQKTMLIMSDVSGAGATVASDGYLTGYPLPESGFYAVARTWSATEMERPGCVWTHTLLLDFADLAALTSMKFLDGIFRRPRVPAGIDDYQHPMTASLSSNRDLPDLIPQLLLRSLLEGLYAFPKEKIVAQMSDVSDELVFAIWAQQWPRLRRMFRFCTASFADRSMDGARFDLQFAPMQDRAYKSRFADALDVERVLPQVGGWLDDATDDITAGKAGKLRAFLKDVGGETPGGRELFAPLCTLHGIIPHFDSDARNIADAIAVIDSVSETAPANSLRATLVSAAVRHPENLSIRSAEFLLAHFNLVDQNDSQKPFSN